MACQWISIHSVTIPNYNTQIKVAFDIVTGKAQNFMDPLIIHVIKCNLEFLFEVNSPLLAGLNTYTSWFRLLMIDGKVLKDLIPAQQTPFWHSLKLVPNTHVGHIYNCAYAVYIQICLNFFFCCPRQMTVSVRIRRQVQKY